MPCKDDDFTCWESFKTFGKMMAKHIKEQIQWEKDNDMNCDDDDVLCRASEFRTKQRWNEVSYYNNDYATLKFQTGCDDQDWECHFKDIQRNWCDDGYYKGEKKAKCFLKFFAKYEPC